LAIRQETEKERILFAISQINEKMSLAEIRETLSAVKNSESRSDKSKTAAAVLEEIKQSLEMPPSCDKTGIYQLDMAMGGGLYSSFVYGLCGAEKSGKTTLAHTISYNLDKQGTNHAYFALEMGSMYIEQRNISRDLGINSLAFLNKRDEIKKRLAEVKPRQHTFYVDAPSFTVNEIIEEASRMVTKIGIKGFIVDYWQLVSGADNRQTEEKHLRDVAQKLADFAKKNKIWVVILAQMNQDGKLFGGGGLKKACEQLYMIRQVEGADDMRWLEMDATRYTLKVNVGSDAVPSMVMETKVGPYFREV
jgi:replicative DNA helicase